MLLLQYQKFAGKKSWGFVRRIGKHGAETKVSDDEPPEVGNDDGADIEISDDEPPEECNEESGGYDMSYSSSSS